MPASALHVPHPRPASDVNVELCLERPDDARRTRDRRRQFTTRLRRDDHRRGDLESLGRHRAAEVLEALRVGCLAQPLAGRGDDPQAVTNLLGCVEVFAEELAEDRV